MAQFVLKMSNDELTTTSNFEYLSLKPLSHAISAVRESSLALVASANQVEPWHCQWMRVLCAGGPRPILSFCNLSGHDPALGAWKDAAKRQRYVVDLSCCRNFGSLVSVTAVSLEID